MRLVPRTDLAARIERRLRASPAVLLLGPRQCGKTTLARALASGRRAEVFDLESPADRQRLAQPLTALAPLKGLVVIDEAQLQPELFAVLRVLLDRRPLPARFLLLGSASADLVRGASESLAGRLALVPMGGFALPEVGATALRRLWSRGGLPRSFLARSDEESRLWRDDFVQTLLERDLPRFGVQVPAPTLRRFWSMVAHYHGQIWNASEFARAFGVSEASVRRYADLLIETFVVRRLLPWSENLGKRQVKSPKLYIADPGILHSLLGIENRAALENHPKVGASWEGFGITQVAERLGASRDECYFWGTQAGAELDLLVVRGERRMGFEFKRTVAPQVTKSMHIALEDLRLSSLDVVHAGDQTFPMRKGIRALSLKRILTDLQPLR